MNASTPLVDHGSVRWVARISTWAGHLAGLCAFLLLVLTVALVLLRKVGFSHIGLDELRWHLYGAMFLFGMALCLARDGHVRVDILSARLPWRLRLLNEVFAMWLLALPVCGLIVWYGLAQTWMKFDTGEGSENPQGLPYRWIIYGCIPLGFTLLGLQAGARGLQALITVCSPPGADLRSAAEEPGAADDRDAEAGP